MVLRGEKGSPFANGCFQVRITCPDGYPREAPKTTFVTPIFHPNVFDHNYDLCWHSEDNTGERYVLDAVVGAINPLLETPNPDDPANREAPSLYLTNRNEYNRRARQMTNEHAI